MENDTYVFGDKPSLSRLMRMQYQPGRAYPIRLHVRPAKTQISLCIRAGLSESSLSAWRRFESLANHRASCGDSDQTLRMRKAALCLLE